MNITPNPNYFIIKIEIAKQKERQDKIGNLYLHFNEVHMERNLQQGEIVGIGSEAAKAFPEAKIGDTLLVHHFVEGSNKEGASNLVFELDGFNYYYATAMEFEGHRNESYAVYRNGEIIPHPEFVFVLPEPKKESEVDLKELGKEIGINPNIPMSVSASGILLFNEWKETREEKELKATILMNEVKHASKGKTLKDDVKIGLEEKQREGEAITASLNRKEYIPFTLYAYHPSLQKSFNKNLNEVKKIFCLNIAANLTFELMDKEYIIVQKKYVAAVA